MSAATVLLTLSCAPLLGLVSVYNVAPVKAGWNGWTHRGGALSEIITCSFDSLAYVELFAGDSGSTGGGYHVSVREGGVELTRADGAQLQPTSWVRFDNWSDTVAFTKGKMYEFRFTRSGSDSIQCYYDTMCGYHYGQMIAPSPQGITPDFGLAMRCYGRLKPANSGEWGATCIIPARWQDPLPRHLWSDSMKASRARWGTLYIRWNEVEPQHNSFNFWD